MWMGHLSGPFCCVRLIVPAWTWGASIPPLASFSGSLQSLFVVSSERDLEWCLLFDWIPDEFLTSFSDNEKNKIHSKSSKEIEKLTFQSGLSLVSRLEKATPSLIAKAACSSLSKLYPFSWEKNRCHCLMKNLEILTHLMVTVVSSTRFWFERHVWVQIAECSYSNLPISTKRSTYSMT